MTKTLLLAGAATAFFAVPAAAQSIGSNVNFNNNISTSLVNNSTYNSNTSVNGNVTVNGNIEVDSSAVATSDSKQINDGNTVVLSEGDDSNGNTAANASSNNYSGAGSVNADGNVGVNSAAGFYNQQSNIGTIGVASTDSPNADDGGWAKANTTTMQSTTNTAYAREESGSGANATSSSSVDGNYATVGNVGGSGNIGVNSASGAFNSQQNIMTLAVASDSSLADASAGVVQYTNANYALVQNSTNSTQIGSVTGAGNISVNAAVGIGNQQHNSLTVAASGAFGGGAGTGGTGNGGL